MTIKIRQNDRSRPFRALAFDGVARIDFPAEFPGGVVFKMVGAASVTGAAIADASGNLSYAWGATDTAVVGTYQAVFVATDGAGKKQTFPGGTNIEIEIIPEI